MNHWLSPPSTPLYRGCDQPSLWALQVLAIIRLRRKKQEMLEHSTRHSYLSVESFIADFFVSIQNHGYVSWLSSRMHFGAHLTSHNKTIPATKASNERFCLIRVGLRLRTLLLHFLVLRTN